MVFECRPLSTLSLLLCPQPLHAAGMSLSGPHKREILFGKKALELLDVVSVFVGQKHRGRHPAVPEGKQNSLPTAIVTRIAQSPRYGTLPHFQQQTAGNDKAEPNQQATT